MKIILIVLSIISSNAYADLAGKWQGFGNWTYQGASDRCLMTLKFDDTKKSLIRHSSSFDCTMVGLEINEAEFAKSGNNLLDSEGKIVGTYQNNTITLSEPYSENVKINSIIKVDGLHLDYSEKWIEKDGSEIYDITGRLFTNK